MQRPTGTGRAALVSLAFLAMGPGISAATTCAPGTDVVRCRVDEINALDRDVAQAFSAASVMLDANGRQKLRRDQDLYEAVRKAGQSGRDFDLAAQISLRRDFLRAIREPRGKWLGQWASANGTIDIAAEAGGGLRVRASAVEPAGGAWLCEFDETAVIASGVMIVGAASAKLELGGPNEGWTLALRLVGDVLTLDALPPRGSTALAPFCTKGGSLNGTYFAQSATPSQRTSGIKQ